MLDHRVHTFLTVCHYLNFTHAAEDLRLSQPAVSQHIRSLEEHYHVKLFRYHKKKLSLTPEGNLLFQRLTSMENDEAAIAAELHAGRNPQRQVDIGVTMTIGEYAAVPLLAGFIHAHPLVNLRVHYGNTQQLLAMLDKGSIALALIEGNYPSQRYGHLRFRTEDFIAVASACHIFTHGTPHRLRDMLGERLLVREPGSGTREILEHGLLTQGLQVSDFPTFTQIENMHTLIQLLERDCGISFLYRIAAEDGLTRGELQQIDLDDFRIRHDFDFVWDRHSLYAGDAESLAQEFAEE